MDKTSYNLMADVLVDSQVSVSLPPPADESPVQVNEEDMLPRQDFSGESVLPRQDFSRESVLPRQDFSGESVLPRQDFSGESVVPAVVFVLYAHTCSMTHLPCLKLGSDDRPLTSCCHVTRHAFAVFD